MIETDTEYLQTLFMQRDATVRLFDMQGRLVKKTEHFSINSRQTIGVSGLPNGTYSFNICEATLTQV